MSGIDCEVNFDARAEYLQHGKTFDEGAMPTKVKSTQTSDVLGEAENRERQEGWRGLLLGSVALWEEGRKRNPGVGARASSPAVKRPQLIAAGIAIYNQGSRLLVAVTTVS